MSRTARSVTRRAWKKRTSAGVLGGALASVVLVACGSFDDTAESTPDASTVAQDSSAKDSGAEADAGLPDHAALVTLMADVVADQIVMNGVLYSYFAPNTQPGRSPSLNDIEECVAYQLGSLLGNGDVYPPAAPLADKYVCRASMNAIHAPLEVPGPVFAQFVSAIVVESTVRNIVLPLDVENQLLGLEPEIADPDAPDASLPYGWPYVTDASTDASDASGADGAAKDAGQDGGSDAASDASNDGGGDASFDGGDDGGNDGGDASGDSGAEAGF